MKPKLKLNSFNILFLRIKNTFLVLAKFFSDLKKCYLAMTGRERLCFFSFMVLSFFFLSLKSYNIYIDSTVLAPAEGGKYQEIVIGETKTLNPILVQTDAGKSTAKLIFSSLIKITGQNDIEPSVAEKWEVSPDGKVYTFFLNREAAFSDGMPLTAKDVVYTLDLIKDQNYKSPLYPLWVGIEAEIIDDYTLRFVLPTSYGPFLYNCDFGIIPSHLSKEEFNRNVVASGRYQVSKVEVTGSKITALILQRNDHYFGQKPYITEICLSYTDDTNGAIKSFSSDKKVHAIFGVSAGFAKKMDYSSGRKLGLVINTKDQWLSDPENRRKLLAGESFESKIQLSLITQDNQRQVEKANSIKSSFIKQNVDLDVKVYDSIKFQEALSSRKYQLLLHGFNFAHDRDPYAFWHSSQIDKLNYSGFSDKALDILLEDARMTIDKTERNQLYDQIFEKVAENSLGRFYDPLEFGFSIKDNLMGVSKINGIEAYSRYDKIEEWYLKQKRVRR